MKTKEIAFWGIMLSCALIAGFAERMMPSPVPAVPGVKLGLANAVPLILLYIRNAKTAFAVNIMRIVLSGVLFSGPWGMAYACAGAVVSFTAMLAMKKTGFFSVVGVSVAGGVFHNIGQICLAAFVVENTGLLFYLPILILSGTITGAAIGVVSAKCVSRLKKL